MINNEKLNSNTRVYGIFETTHACNYRKLALNCFFLNHLDVIELMDDLKEQNRNSFYSTLSSTYGEIFEGGISYSGARPMLYKNLDEYYAYQLRDDEKQL